MTEETAGTPRTDAALAVGSVPFEAQEQILITQVVPAAFARQLEREVAALTAESKKNKAGWDMCLTNLRYHSERANAAEAELDAAKRALADAARYQFLKPLYTCIDFEYGDSSEGATPSIVFAIPPGTRWSGDLDKSIDAALAAKSTEQPMNCKEAGPGRGLCAMCAAGRYEECLYVQQGGV